jgi:transcriptional regulator with GAF, ATPase, and Fis domain
VPPSHRDPNEDSHEPTLERSDPLRLARATHRDAPTLSWVDASGPHAVRLGARAVAGSAPGADLLLADRTVSRLHAEFEQRADGLWVRDLGSKNGTFVQGVCVAEARVPAGGRVQLGDTVLTAAAEPSRATVALWPTDRFGSLVGASAAMRELFANLAQIARTDSTVLVHGETGTGKELVAEAIHTTSRRRDGAFVVVDCAGLPENLLEAELFGHAKGAFTGAASARAGAIEAADGGTVFLDEIGELPLAMQPKLLRVLESRTVRRLGEAQHRPVDVRFVSATHRDLRAMVNAGAFREDLYFRLAVIPVEVPPLRARLEDVPRLAEHFLPPEARGALTPELLRELSLRPWSGNVRELRNFVERAVAVGARTALAMEPRGGPAPAAAGRGGAAPEVSIELPLRESRERWSEHFEREYVRRLLEHHGGNVPAAAQAARCDRTYIYRLIRKYDL